MEEDDDIEFVHEEKKLNILEFIFSIIIGLFFLTLFLMILIR